MSSGGSGQLPGDSPSPIAQARRSRFLGQQYADITKLREIGARHEHKAARTHQRISRLNTRIDKLVHQATVLREKSQTALGRVPEIEQEIAQRQRDVESVVRSGRPSSLTSDVTAANYRIRKLQQRVIDLRTRSRGLELRAAQRTQRSSELKVKVDRLLEIARTSEQEAGQYRQRADRLQLVSEQETISATSAEAPASGAPPRPP